MSSHVDEKTLDHLQNLTHVHLNDEEKIEMQKSLDAVIGMLDQLQDVDVSDVESLVHPVSGHVMRLGDASPQESDNVALLKNVSHRMVNNAIKIKSMIEQESE